MLVDVTRVNHIEGHVLEIAFENGEVGKVNLGSYVTKGGVFSRWSNIEYFKQAQVNGELGTVCWPGGEDIAPETLYRLAKTIALT